MTSPTKRVEVENKKIKSIDLAISNLKFELKELNKYGTESQKNHIGSSLRCAIKRYEKRKEKSLEIISKTKERYKTRFDSITDRFVKISEDVKE